jgi:hypothetical protein
MAPVGNYYLLKTLTPTAVFNAWVLPTTMRAEVQQAFLRIAGLDAPRQIWQDQKQRQGGEHYS